MRRSWRVGADCKSVAIRLSRFESYRPHKNKVFNNFFDIKFVYLKKSLYLCIVKLENKDDNVL